MRAFACEHLVRSAHLGKGQTGSNGCNQFLRVEQYHRHDDAAWFRQRKQLILCRSADGVDYRIGASGELREARGWSPDCLVRLQRPTIIGIIATNAGDHPGAG
jgi:hypothetical protein